MSGAGAGSASETAKTGPAEQVPIRAQRPARLCADTVYVAAKGSRRAQSVQVRQRKDGLGSNYALQDRHPQESSAGATPPRSDGHQRLLVLILIVLAGSQHEAYSQRR